MSVPISPELRGMAEAYGVQFETADEALRGIRAYFDKLGPDDQRDFQLANGQALLHADAEVTAAHEASQKIDFASMHPHVGREAFMRSGGAEIAGDAERKAAQEKPAALPRRMTRDEKADALWAEATATYDIPESDHARVDDVARRITQERGYIADDFNDPAMRSEFVHQVGAALGLKAKGASKAVGKPDRKGASKGDDATSLNYGGRGMAAKDTEAPPRDDENLAWLRETTEMQYKRGLK